MFLPENPIEKYDDDFLGRKKFAEHLSKAVIDWKEQDSLVIALYGKWGVGKTSLLNMTMDYLNTNCEDKEKYNIVKFNPWAFSESDNLLECFIQELISGIKKTKHIDKILIQKLEYYSSLLTLTPKEEEINISLNAIVSLIALLGISISQIDTLIAKIPNVISAILLWGGVGYFLVIILKQIIEKILNFYKVNSQYKEKSVNETKKDIVNILQKKSQKMLIVVDDIDRLSTQEIRQIFRIVRTNADFPNTIYLLAFDRDVIEKNLAVQEGISGHDYLEKIVQVNFTLPYVSESKIYSYLLNELERLFSVLPESVKLYFKDETHWVDIFHSGFKKYFKSIRDVKRFINSLEFNISQLIQEDVIEVNPVDFLAIELLRVFEPRYYEYLLRNKTLFTETSSSYSNGESERDKKKELVTKSLLLSEEENRDDLKNMIFELFPQVKGFAAGYGNVHYGYDSERTWTQDLRICSSRMFDSYFNFIPGGDEKELSIYDLNKVSIASCKYEDLNELFNYYKSINKFENLIIRIQDFTSKKDFFKKENFEFIIQALFDSYINLPKIEPNMFGIGLDMQIVRVIFQLLTRNPNLEENYQILVNTTKKSRSIYGPLLFLGIEIKKEDKESSTFPNVIPIEKVSDIKTLCINKITENKSKLFDDENFLYLIFRWKEWSQNSEYNDYIKDLFTNEDKFLLFFDKFEYESRSQTMGDYKVRISKRFNYKNLAVFCDLGDVKEKIELIKKDPNVYEKHKSSIDLFLKYYEKRNSDFVFDIDE